MDTYTYCGLLDDFTLRHDDKGIRSLQELNEHLILSALFGGRLLINDGYVIFNEALQDAVLHKDASPLQHLVEKGYVKILTRNGGNLEILADKMANDGITSAQDLTGKPWYKVNYRPALTEWSVRLRSPAFDGFMNWPIFDRDEIFRSVAKTAFHSLYAAESRHRPALELFDKTVSDTPGRRTEWEDEASKLEKSGRIFSDVRRILMFTASEAYHYSWGCALGAAGHRVRVLTRLPKYLHGLDSSLGQLPERPTSQLKIFVPDLTFSKKAIKNRWQLLADMVSPGHQVSLRKEEFLDCRDRYYASNGTTEKEVHSVAKAYATALSRHFGNQEAVPVVFDLGFLAASTAAGAAVGNVPGIFVGLGIGLVGVAGAHLGGPQMFWKLAAPKPKWIARLQRAPEDHAVSSFELSRDQISKHTSQAGPFK
jgi:hypothetical protein